MQQIIGNNNENRSYKQTDRQLNHYAAVRNIFNYCRPGDHMFRDLYLFNFSMILYYRSTEWSHVFKD